MRDLIVEKDRMIKDLRSELNSALQMHHQLQSEFKLELQQLNLKNENLASQLKAKESEVLSSRNPGSTSESYATFDLNLKIKKYEFDLEQLQSQLSKSK